MGTKRLPAFCGDLCVSCPYEGKIDGTRYDANDEEIEAYPRPDAQYK
jgi:hypothetical protein